jgi:hypothetical protein
MKTSLMHHLRVSPEPQNPDQNIPSESSDSEPKDDSDLEDDMAKSIERNVCQPPDFDGD